MISFDNLVFLKYTPPGSKDLKRKLLATRRTSNKIRFDKVKGVGFCNITWILEQWPSG